jgi:CBS domain-containing protein
MTTVRDAMTPGVETVSPSQPLREAAKLMKRGDFGSIPVVENGRLVGVVTDRDIVVRAVAQGLDTSSAQVREVASTGPVTVEPNQDLDEALRLMAQHRVRRLPVVEGEMLVGVLSQADVALESRDSKTGDLVQEISQPTSTPRD